jgi:7,8-dihydropterin-6-yl-methyl-4-(beta-D-ribofuranosyl)aminobenzene 5'-phosphate synthase
MSAVRVTILAEDTAGPRGTIGEHGLAVWIEKDGRALLFDTGQGLALTRNAEILGLDLSRVEAIVISHGHYDHTGGLNDALALSPEAPFFLHPSALDAKYRPVESGQGGEIGIPPLSETGMKRARIAKGACEVFPGVWTTGEIPRRTAFEDTGGLFYRDASCTAPDPLLDDQALFFEASKGMVVVLGCAHAGVVNTLQHIRRQSQGRRIHAILGGMHLLNASKDRIERTIAVLAGLGMDLICPCHCTGAIAIQALRLSFGDRVQECRTGSRFVFSAS